MSETSRFFVDIVNSMPLDSEWFFQAPHKEFTDALQGVKFESAEVFIKLVLKEENRKRLAEIAINDVHEYVQQLKIFWKGEKIFEAYDGFVIGTVSKHFDISKTALLNHLDQDILFISSEW